MRRFVVVLFVLLTAAFPGSLFAQSISESDAKSIAQNFFAKMSDQSFRAVSDEPSEEKNVPLSATGQNNDTLYYVVNNANNTGFVIVAADERVWPILGYSLHGEFNADNQPPAFVNWMENRKKEIEFIKQNQTLPESTVAEQWENLNDATPILKSTATSVAPLLQTTWNQGCFYNELCPVDAAGPCGRVWAGCTATAMAQIMKYWGFPSTGTGSYSYTHTTYGIQSADFGSTTYQWSQMPNNVTEANNAVATLLYHCGVAVNMNYSPSGSGAPEPSDELVEYFGYSPNAQFVEKNDYTEIEWINLLKSELNLKRPIWYDGFNPSSGHAFICDGYREDDYFHFNWGWGGYADGYFYLGSLNAIPDQEGYDFTDDQGAVINVFPSDLPDGYNGFFISGNNFEIEPFGGDESLLVFSSTNWTASSNQSWLSLNSSSGLSGKSTLQFVAEKNETGNTRSAEITISVLGHDNQIVEISQSSDSIVNVTPGELYSQISTFLSNLEYLTINGSIDARDFQIMRDSIPNLKGIDLSNASIVSYTGTFGTSGTSTVTYPANQIPDYAFNKPVSNSGKPSLETIILPNTVVSIGNYAFYRCSGLKSFPTSSSITTIGKFAFYRCTGLRSIVLPSGLTTINSYAFYYCTESDSIYIPSSVALIDDNVFRDFSGLINVDPNNNVYSSEDGVLFNKNKTTLFLCPTSKEGHYYVPSNVTTINNSAFYKCSKLTSIVLPTNLTTIGSETFYSCSGLIDIQLPSSLTSIGNYSFRYCNKLSSISIPPSVTSIGSYAFYGDTSLSRIEVYKASPVNLSSSTSVFYNVNKTTCKLYVPFGSANLYAVANQWSDFNNIIEMPGVSLSSTNVAVEAAANSSDTVLVSSNTTWTASSNQVWLAVSPTSGTGNQELVLTAEANPNTAPRLATITVSAQGVDDQFIELTQQAAEENLVLDYLSVADTTINNIQVNCFNAVETITVAGEPSNVFISNGATVNFIAGRSIVFLPGFYAEAGSNVHAYITTDATFCTENGGGILQNPIAEKSVIINNVEHERSPSNDFQKMIKVFPNPNNGSFVLELKNFDETAKVYIYSILGSVVYENVVRNQRLLEIDMQYLNKGLYFVKVLDGNESLTNKIIVH